MWMWSTGINRNIVECKVHLMQTFHLNQSSINRNIVECKAQQFPKRLQLWGCINRNIVECKGDFVNTMTFDRLVVLIETLWNVK